MPQVDDWESFFEPEKILSCLRLTSECHDVIEFGCGYGTFTLPAARRVAGTVFALDIDPAMISVARRRASTEGLKNIEFLTRDFVADGTGLPDCSVDYAMLFNILHCEDPTSLLREAFRNLKQGGSLAIIHWRHDVETPRGPPRAMRPRPEECKQWGENVGFSCRDSYIALPPYHYGLLMRREPSMAQ